MQILSQNLRLTTGFAVLLLLTCVAYFTPWSYIDLNQISENIFSSKFRNSGSLTIAQPREQHQFSYPQYTWFENVAYKTNRDHENVTYKEGDKLNYVFSGLKGRNFTLTKLMARNLNKLDEIAVDELERDDVTKFPVVTCASKNHFKEAATMVRYAQKNLPGHPIYYVDLGLTSDQVKEVYSVTPKPE